MKRIRHCLAFFGALLSAGCYAQNAASLEERLAKVETVTSLDDAAMTPWHLKLSVQLFNGKGDPSETGTIEEYWGGPHQYRRTFNTPSYTATDGETSEGSFRSESAAAPPYFLETILKEFVHPLPLHAEIASSLPELHKQSFGRVALECIMLTRQTKNISEPPLGFFPTYCLDPGQEDLRIRVPYIDEMAVRNGITKFSGKLLPVTAQLGIDGKPTVRAELKELDGTATPADLAMPADAVKVDPVLTVVPGKVVAGTKIGGEDPVYPVAAKVNGATGLVVLKAVIDTEGHIRSLHLDSAPDLDLAISAFAAVRTWRYKPYLSNGKPVSIETTISVNYEIGR